MQPMRWKAFGDLCQYKVPSLRVQSRNENTETVETRRRAIATCLHQTGEVIYFDECGVLILDYEWFCGEVLAQLIKLDSRKQRNGFVSKKEMEKIIEAIYDLLGEEHRKGENAPNERYLK